MNVCKFWSEIVANPGKTLSLSILEREYRVNGAAGAEEKLRAAARMLDEKMNEIKKASSASGTVPGLDRIAVIAALNIAHQLQETQGNQQADKQSIEYMHKILDEAIEENQQLDRKSTR